jgi:hypothetical protein
MRKDRGPARGLPALGARLVRTVPTLAGLTALAVGIGWAASGAAFAQTVKDATFTLSMEVFGNSDDASKPGTYSIDNFCNDSGCGSASATMTANVAGEQTTSGSALSSKDIGALFCSAARF